MRRKRGAGVPHEFELPQGSADLGRLLSRRQILKRATVLGVGGLIVSALPAADRILATVAPSEAAVNLADATLQAVADTFIPGRKAPLTDLGHEIHPKAIAGVHHEPGAVETDALALFHDPLIGFDALEPAFLAEVETRSLMRGGQFLDLDFANRIEVLKAGLAASNPSVVGVGGGRGRPVRGVHGSGGPAQRLDRHGLRLPGDRPPGHRAKRLRRVLVPASAALARAHDRPRGSMTGREEPQMAERVDVCIVGSGFGGSISAYRLAELYQAAGVTPSIMVLERGRRHTHTDFRQSMDIEHLSKTYGLVQGQGAQVVIGDGVGGGSNLYLAASLRSPRETFERRDRRPGDGPERRMWPSEISRAALNPYYRRVELALRVQRPSWKQIAKSGGLWADTRPTPGTRATACRSRST